jgi:hypothetical protein
MWGLSLLARCCPCPTRRPSPPDAASPLPPAYRSDTYSHRLLLVAPSAVTGVPTVTTLAGNGSAATFEGVPPPGSGAVLGVSVALGHPAGLAVDAPRGRLLVAEVNGHALRALDLARGGLTTVVGGVEPGTPAAAAAGGAGAVLAHPHGVAVSAASGAVAVADTSGHRVVSVVVR